LTDVIGILIFQDVEELDFVGPYEVLSAVNRVSDHALQVYLLAEKDEPVECQNRMEALPHVTYENCPRLDVIIIPGGAGARLGERSNQNTLDFIKHASNNAKLVCSVCTGAFLLTEAKVIEGGKITTHHDYYEQFEKRFDRVILVRGPRVVRDGRFLIAAGVSAGIDLGLEVIKILFSESLAAEVAELIEYSISAHQQR